MDLQRYYICSYEPKKLPFFRKINDSVEIELSKFTYALARVVRLRRTQLKRHPYFEFFFVLLQPFCRKKAK